MLLSNVNIGSGPSAGDGDPLRTAFNVINENFAIVNSNVSRLTNSVTSVAGRQGNVLLTVNDIIGISQYANTAYTTATITAQVNALRFASNSSVDAKIQANIANLINSAPGALNTLNELAAALGNDANFASTLTNLISSVNGNVDALSSDVSTLFANAITQQGRINTLTSVTNSLSANTVAQETKLNTLLGSTYSNVNVANYLPTYTGNIWASHVDIQGDLDTGANGLTVGLAGEFTQANSIATFHANVDSDAFITVHNKNTGTRATAGFVASSDLGNDINHSMLIGILNSDFNSGSPGPLKPLDSVLFATGGNLNLITSSNTDEFKDIVFTTINSIGYDQPVKITVNRSLYEYEDENGDPQIGQDTTANLQLDANVGIKFSDGTVQYTAYTSESLTALEGNVSSLQSDVSDLYANASAQQEYLNSLGAVDLAAINSAIGTQAGQISILESQVASLETGNTVQLTSDVADLKSNVTILFANAVSQGAYMSTVNANYIAANIAMKGYVDFANTVQAGAINVANVGMKGYVDAVTTAWQANASAQGNLISAIQGNISVLFSNAVSQGASITNLQSSVGSLLGQIASVPSYANVSPTPTGTGTKGNIVVDGSYIYFCIAANTWVRSSITTSW